MSNLTVKGNASGTGTVILEAPNTNSNRTITLPDATGTVNVSGLANEVPAGSAGAPAIYPTGDTNTGVFFPAAADTVAVATGGAERMRVDSSGFVGIGTTSPASLFDIRGSSNGQNVLQLSNSAGTNDGGAENQIRVTCNGNTNWANLDVQAYTTILTTNGSERARIDASGLFLVGTASGFDNVSSLIAQFLGGVATKINSTASTSQMSFFNPNGRVGFISTSGSATTYSTSSDYRLKENVAPMQNALDTVSQLNPVTYTWKADGSAGQGFIAHELQAVVPDCVTGEKDAVDAEGNPQYQGVDTSFLVATLVKAIQELTARIAILEAN